eukprot:TRINITY_DN5215_c0_g1_i1.p1 TRINITY_DN5215_c0_g1~~TRINITY_DN5215_c0_g1_i1.p1  ORF type:complete len:139 (-),score=37.27 TRINITY_DN5215_c0_g1_i1:152-568(-)
MDCFLVLFSCPPPFPEEMASMIDLWQKHDDDWAASKGTINRGEWGHFTGVAVHQDYLSRGIARNLYEANIKLLKNKGYKGALAENVSAFSARAAEAAGATLVSYQEYATYEYPAGSGKFPLAIVKPPHVTFQLREVKF